MNKPTTLYRFFDQHDRLLYVGISAAWWARWQSHKGDKPWWLEVHKSILEHYDDKKDAQDAEVRAIKEERPVYNIQHNNNGQHNQPDGPIGGPWRPTESDALGHTPESVKSAMAQAGFTPTTPTSTAKLESWWLIVPREAPVRQEYQGQIVNVLDGSLVLIEWFSWWDGSTTHFELIDLATIVEHRWRLYDRHQDFLDAGQAVIRGRDRRARTDPATSASSDS